MWNLQLPLLAATLVSVFFAQTVLAQEISRSQNLINNLKIPSLRQVNLTVTNATKRIRQLSELEPVLTTARTLLVQSQTPASEIVEVTQVKANPTNKGVEIILQTTKGQQLQLINRSSGNNFITDVPNAQLRLPSGDTFTFRSDKPIAGVSEITVSNFDANTIRVTVTGEVGKPIVELYDSADEGIIFSVASSASATPSQQPQTQPPSQTQPTQPLASGDEPIELVVTGEQDGYNAPNSSTATRTDTPLRDIPQSVQVIPQAVIKDQQITRISDATRNVSGVSPVSGYGGFSDSYTTRGFDSNILINGFTTSNFFSYGANVERVEVLKGPSSVLYGQSEPGGTINFVTKQPLSSPYYAADFTAGSFSFYRGAIDLSGPLSDDKKLLYRLNVAYENSGSFRDFYHQEIFSVTPVITYKPSENTILSFEYEYGRRRGSFDRGFSPTSPVFLTLPVSRFLGEPSDFLNIDYQRGTATVDHRFSQNLQLRSSFSVQSTFDNNVYTQAAGDIEADGRSVERDNIVNRNRRNENYFWQTDLIGKFNTGSVAHQLLLGLELRRNTDINPNFFGGDIAPIDIFNPVYGARPTGPVVLRVFGTRISTTGVYLQDQVTLRSNLKLLVGGRYDFVFSDNSAKIGDAETTNSNFYDSAFSPRVGLVYQPIEPISLYASYSRSFVPNDGTTASGALLEPSRGTQYEVGIKSELFDRRLSATLAAYDITKTNIPNTDPNNTDFSIAVGEVKSRGIELDMAGEILPGWKIIASGYLNDAFVSEDNDPTIKGQRLVNTAYNGATLWTTYEIQQGSLKGLQFGGGIFYVGSRTANQSYPVTLPSYLRTDAAISYKHDNWRAAVNLKNIFNVKYYDTSGYFLVPQAPLTVLGTISVEF
ncbi:TonB-dependent siderophore receptor [Nostoc sp.]|uniref:TonB-dependent siderophore receptor n=1 Tax=Nostoc sp. TaxID=1180 RepID=UPI002FF72A0D